MDLKQNVQRLIKLAESAVQEGIDLREQSREQSKKAKQILANSLLSYSEEEQQVENQESQS